MTALSGREYESVFRKYIFLIQVFVLENAEGNIFSMILRVVFSGFNCVNELFSGSDHGTLIIRFK